MAFKLYALFFVACVAAVRPAIIQNELSMPIGHSAHDVLPHETLPQIPFRPPTPPFKSIPSPGITLQSGAVQYFAPEENLIPFDQVEKLLKETGLVAKLKFKVLKVLKKGIKVVAKVIVVAVVALALAALGVALTFAICKHTSLCEFKFHSLEFDKEYAGDYVEAVRSFASNEKLTALTKFVVNAIEQYAAEEK